MPCSMTSDDDSSISPRASSLTTCPWQRSSARQSPPATCHRRFFGKSCSGTGSCESRPFSGRASEPSLRAVRFLATPTPNTLGQPVRCQRRSHELHTFILAMFHSRIAQHTVRRRVTCEREHMRHTGNETKEYVCLRVNQWEEWARERRKINASVSV